jgi:hypothetical protein
VNLFFRRAVIVLCPLLLLAVSSAHAEADIDSANVREITATLSAHASAAGVSITNRAAWEKLAANAAFQQTLRAAEAQLSQPMPQTSDELYLEYSRNGNRTRWQSVAAARRNRMSVLALAECLENKGRFLPALESAIKEICAETSWLYPAHDRDLKNFKGTSIDIDLGSSRLAWEMATINSLLGEKLSPATRASIRENLEHRIFKPYRDMVEGRRKENGWLRVTSNWNAVCHAGVVGAALASIDSREDRAWFIASAQFYLKNFLSGFGADGYCSEGLGYWNYGFGNFIMLTETVRQATHGQIDFLADPQARRAALFGQRVEILNGIYPSIADCNPGSKPDAQITAYICRRLNLTPCDARPEIFVRPNGDLFNTALFSFLPENLPVVANNSIPESPLRTWFSEAGVLIARPAPNDGVPFAVSLKGGNNAEHHNHNDLGSFIVVAGNSMVLVDPGSEIYTARTFGSHRYDSDVLNSFGHDVPVIAGKLQSSGSKALAKVLNTSFTEAEDRFSLDLTSAYAVPTLKKLERHFTFSRGKSPSLTVRDDVEFTQAESFETALVTWGKWEKISDNELKFAENKSGVRVKIETGEIPFEITSKQLEADVPTPKATRIGLRLKEPILKGRVVLTITPEGNL